MKGAELDKQIYKEGEPTWGCKEGVLDVEDVKKFIEDLWEDYDSLDDLPTRISLKIKLAERVGEKLLKYVFHKNSNTRGEVTE